MRGWLALGLALLIFLLIGQIRVGIAAGYDGQAPDLRVRLGPLRIKVFPRPEKEKKEKKEKKPKKDQKKKKAAGDGGGKKAGGQTPEKKPEASNKEKAKPRNDLLLLAREFVPLALEAAGCFWRRLVVDQLELYMTVGCPDPADAAMLYGQANGALGALWGPLTRAFHVRDGRAQVRVDFQAQGTTVRGRAALSLKIGQILWLGLYFAVKALRRLLRYRREMKGKQLKRKAV